MEFVQGPYIKKDLKRIKVVSAENDIENHFKIFRGRVTEINSQYSVPLVQAFLYETVVDGVTVYFFKDRCATTNPKYGPSKGLRIVFAVYIKDRKPIQYTPFIVFLANEEGDRYLAPNGRKYKLSKSDFRHIIQAKLEYL